MPVIFVQRVAGPDGVLLPALRAIKFGTGFQVTPHPDDSLTGESGGGEVTGYIEVDAASSVASLEIGASYTLTNAPPVTTTDATVTNLGPAIAVPAGGMLALEAEVICNLIGDGTNPGAALGRLRIKGAWGRLGSATPVMHPSSGDDGSLTVSPPFGVASPLGTIGGGKLAAVIVGNTVQLQVQGEAYGSVTAWQSGTSYAKGVTVTNDSGKLYVVVQSGTSAGSGGPTGTGASITDNGVTWAYVEADGKVTARWTLAKLEIMTG